MLMLPISSLNDNPRDFDKLFDIWNRVEKYIKTTRKPEIKFNFSRCYFLRHNAVAFLGGLVRYIEHHGGTPVILWDTINWSIRTNLQKNGFEGTFGGNNQSTHGNTVPYREYQVSAHKDDVINYLKSDWLGPGWVHVSKMLENAIVSRTWEIYWNACEHSKSPIGIYSCGQRYPRKKELNLTVADFGVGIPDNVQKHLGKHKMPADQALQWAFQIGNTTTKADFGRGLGLDLLKEFVSKNDGKIEVYSHNGYAIISKRIETYECRQSYFPGTLINIKFRCDNKYYCFASENKGKLF